MNDESPAGAAPANPGAPAEQGKAGAATFTLASAPSKDLPQNEPNPIATERTRVADLGTAPSLRGVGAAIEQGHDERQERDAETADSLKEKIGNRATSATTAPLPPPRPALPGDIAVAFADIPTPPARPASLTRVAARKASQTLGEGTNQLVKNDPVNDAATASTANSPLARAANLPVMITQGPKDRASVPKQVLAFASETAVEDLRGAGARQHAGQHNEPTGHATANCSGAPRPGQDSRSRQRYFNRKFPGAVDPWTILHRPTQGGPRHPRCAFKQGFGGICRVLQGHAKRSRLRPFHRAGGQAPRARAGLCSHRGKPRAASQKLNLKIVPATRDYPDALEPSQAA